MSDRYVEIYVDEILRETESAYLCRIEGEDIWLPKSQIKDADNYCDGECEIDMEITRWIAEQKGLV